MGNYEVRFLQAALDDLDEIVRYIARDSRQHALHMHDKIIAAAHRLEEFPMIGFKVPDEKIAKRGFRMLGVAPYLLFYKVFGDKVVILRVLHGRRDYPHLLADMAEEEEP